MSLLLVSYDLKVPGKDYNKLYETLKTAPGWWHHLESTWILSTSDSVNTWADRIRATMDENDFFMVVDITNKPYNGWLPKKAWDWITQNNR
jgi:hypothetical protein